MEFLRRGQRGSGAVALFPGAWNPPTLAHQAIAEAALAVAGEVVFVIPRDFPHKSFAGPGLDQRVRWIGVLAGMNPSFSAAIADGGLFVEMAREARRDAGAERILLLCGSDAAQRIVEWNYGGTSGIRQHLEEYELLVVPRGQIYRPPAEFVSRVHSLELPGDFQGISSTDIRARLERGEPWEHLVPATLLEHLRSAYTL